MIRPLNPATDFAEWLRMRLLLWDDSTAEEHSAEMREFLPQETFAVFVAERLDGGLAGFVEVAERAYADGCDTSPVGYMEGWYVDADMRQKGLGGQACLRPLKHGHASAATAKSALTHGWRTILATPPILPLAMRRWSG
jgi:hypothetical protein